MDWIDYSQNRRLRELQEDVSSAHSMLYSERKRMRSELSSLRGGLEQRLDRVSATLDAFIELSDIRATLAVFSPHALARHRVLAMLDGSVPAVLELEDVPDYWLPPAAHGLHALLTGSPAGALPHLDEAARRDPERAAAFSVLAAALTRAEYARTLGGSGDLLPHLPAPDEQISRGRRALWILTADGSLGEEAREQLLLSTLRHWSALGAEAPALDLSAPAASGRSSRSGRRGGGSAPDAQLDARAAAVDRLTALHGDVARITAPGGDTGAERTAPDEGSASFLTEALVALVEEGTPEEAPLIARANELRAVIENGDGGRRPGWDDGVGTVSSLLAEDLRASGATPHRSTFALVLQRPAVTRTVEDLLRQASAPLPESTTVTVQGVRVGVTENGPTTPQLDRAEQQLALRYRAEQGGRLYVWGLGVLAALLVVLALVSQAGFAWFLAAGCALGAVGFLVRDLREARSAAEAREAQLHRLRREADQAGRQWRERLDEARAREATARKLADEISALLDPR
ncbi:hypothetical protein ACOQFV_29660 [Nocardiopsis changdeensis]|uniref:Uncharacterized protein n=1 Tax=Nocardiopsis changdeensis TaxID=2831969 RepID=A0ABX8BRZ7_9ACTN|nr:MULTISPECIES: hypothetical protein [Nocardiopsis]QUX25010.1 hypothetical protein KGD84_12540 [Nocardiopsis changdeensis]QYX35396.1 hypothetical protein K1J57_21990 [Nocardiopsis sp. MT53]